jgi:hypothetical protein
MTDDHAEDSVLVRAAFDALAVLLVALTVAVLWL